MEIQNPGDIGKGSNIDPSMSKPSKLNEEEQFSLDLQSLKSALEAHLKGQEKEIRKLVSKMSKSISKAIKGSATPDHLQNMLSQFEHKIGSHLSKNNTDLSHWISSMKDTRDIPSATTKVFLDGVQSSQKQTFSHHYAHAKKMVDSANKASAVKDTTTTTTKTDTDGPSASNTSQNSSPSSSSHGTTDTSSSTYSSRLSSSRQNTHTSNLDLNTNPKESGILASLKKQMKGSSSDPYEYLYQYIVGAIKRGVPMGAIYQGMQNELSSGGPAAKAASKRVEKLLSGSKTSSIKATPTPKTNVSTTNPLASQIAETEKDMQGKTGQTLKMFQDLLTELQSATSISQVQNWAKVKFGGNLLNLYLVYGQTLSNKTDPTLSAPAVSDFCSITGLPNPGSAESSPVVMSFRQALIYARNNPSVTPSSPIGKFLSAYQAQFAAIGIGNVTQTAMEDFAKTYGGITSLPQSFQTAFQGFLTNLPKGKTYPLQSQITEARHDLIGAQGEDLTMYRNLISEFESNTTLAGVQQWAATKFQGNYENIYIAYGQTIAPRNDPTISEPSVNEFFKLIGEPSKQPPSATSIPTVMVFRQAYIYVRDNPKAPDDIKNFLIAYQKEFLNVGVQGATQAVFNSWAASYPGGVPSAIESDFKTWIKPLPAGGGPPSNLQKLLQDVEGDMQGATGDTLNMYTALKTELQSVISSSGTLSDVTKWANTLVNGDFNNLYLQFGLSFTVTTSSTGQVTSATYNPNSSPVNSAAVSNFCKIIGVSPPTPDAAVKVFQGINAYAAAQSPLYQVDANFLGALEEAFKPRIGASGSIEGGVKSMTQQALNHFSVNYLGGIPQNLNVQFVAWVKTLPFQEINLGAPMQKIVPPTSSNS